MYVIPKDTTGRPYARLSELRPGDKIETDAGFTCLAKGEVAEVHADASGILFVFCSGHGDFANRSRHKKRTEQHMLDGQADDGEHLIGMYSHG